MYLAWEVQIILLLVKKTIILTKYLDFVNIILKKLAIELSKHFIITKHSIDLEPGK